MLKKIIAIRNVGRFLNSASAGNPELAKHTLIVGANGFGKTTLCAVLRSLKSGDAAHILGRRTLGVPGIPTVELLFPTGVVRFDGATWSSRYPGIAIFDGVFVAENVHSGEVVDIDHRRNLYRVIIGEEGVRLATEEATLAADSRGKTSEIGRVDRTLQPYIPTRMRLKEFMALPVVADIDAKIATQERTVEAARQAKRINDRPSLSTIAIPELPQDFQQLLSATIDDIAKDAEAHLARHLATHGMEADAGNWIAQGLEHTTNDTCPFCGQGLLGLPLIATYRAVFSDRYKALREAINAMRTQVAGNFDERALGSLNVRAEQNRAAVEFWGRYCTFDATPLDFADDILEAARALGGAALAVLDRKERTPLEPIVPDATFKGAAMSYEDAQSRAREINAAIDAANALIAAKKREAGAADVQSAEAELERLKSAKRRHTDPVSGLCAEHVQLTAEKEAMEVRKTEVREKLDQHTKSVMEPYEQRINHYLDAFNAGFRITETKHGYPGGTAASSYQLVINDTAIDVGDARTPPDKPSFKNTLSSGDRTTLALAFFLAHLEQDLDLANKIAVFDDPFNSQDAFRRRQTIHEIVKVARRCGQVIVLSHDATFAKQVWDKVPGGLRVALTIADHRAQGSKLTSVDLERACQGRTATDIDDLQAYLTTGAGVRLDLIRKMRGVLETHCWTSYPAAFQTGRDWLGEIVRKIREGGDEHPAKDLYDELDQINDYTSQYYHGQDMKDATTDEIDPSELTGYVRRTLRLVHALQA